MTAAVKELPKRDAPLVGDEWIEDASFLASVVIASATNPSETWDYVKPNGELVASLDRKLGCLCVWSESLVRRTGEAKVVRVPLANVKYLRLRAEVMSR